MEDGFCISTATLAEAALLAGLHAASFDHARAWDASAMACFVSDPATLCLLAVAPDRAPAGFLIVRQAADEAELLSIGTLPAYRRCGAGRTLLQHASTALEERGVKQIFLEVDESNLGALTFYRALGAIRVGRRPKYYEDGADAAMFSLPLPPTRR